MKAIKGPVGAPEVRRAGPRFRFRFSLWVVGAPVVGWQAAQVLPDGPNRPDPPAQTLVPFAFLKEIYIIFSFLVLLREMQILAILNSPFRIISYYFLQKTLNPYFFFFIKKGFGFLFFL